jgi:hypothetical protein
MTKMIRKRELSKVKGNPNKKNRRMRKSNNHK